MSQRLLQPIAVVWIAAACTPAVMAGPPQAETASPQAPARNTTDEPFVWRTDYAAARNEAKAKGLPLLVVVSAPECFYCRKMDAVTYADPGVNRLVAGKFVPLKIDGNRHQDFARELKITLYPTTVLAKTDGEVIGYLQGYLPPNQFLENAEKALAKIRPAKETVLAAESPRPVPAANPASFAKSTAAAQPLENDPIRPAIPVAVVPQPSTPVVLLAAARQAFADERYGEALERCEQLTTGYAQSPQATEAARIVASIQADPVRLAVAEAQIDERTAATYLALAESWLARGRNREAAACFEKALKILPPGKLNDRTQVRLAGLRPQPSQNSPIPGNGTMSR